jgi:hypothetical protein
MAKPYEHAGYDPPAAVAKVVVRDIAATRHVAGLRMLIDSGAALKAWDNHRDGN